MRQPIGRPRASRELASVALSALLVASCTDILGIDGTYVVRSEAEAGGSSDVIVEDGGPGGTTGAGGVVIGSGGRIGSGGTIVVATGGVPADSGILDSDSGAGCQPGKYTGSFDGSHRVGATFVGVQGTVDPGTITFELQGSGGALTVASGKLDAQLTTIGTSSATLSATLTGTLDCSTRTIVGGQLTGQIKLFGAVPAPMSGTWEGSMSTTGAFDGTWVEEEPVRPAPGSGGAAGVCVPGTNVLQQPSGTGCGTWNAHTP